MIGKFGPTSQGLYIFVEIGKVYRQDYSDTVPVANVSIDYLSFQSGLLKKDVRYIAQAFQILSNGEEQISSTEAVRVLQDRENGRRSILFYASNRGPNRIAGFMEWPGKLIPKLSSNLLYRILRIRADIKIKSKHSSPSKRGSNQKASRLGLPNRRSRVEKGNLEAHLSNN